MISSVRIGNIEIPMRYLMLTIGLFGMILCVCKRRERFVLTVWKCVLFAILLTVCGVAGAMLLYFLECGESGGVSFYGSVFLIPLLMPLLGFLFRLKPGQTMDICGPCVAIMIGCMRFSCFLTGCCGGWTVCLDNICFAWPTQMLESIGDFAIMTWLLQSEEKEPNTGKLYPMLMMAYSTMRFFLEFLRDTSKDWLYMSHGQWFALIAIILGVIWTMLLKKKENAI